MIGGRLNPVVDLIDDLPPPTVLSAGFLEKLVGARRLDSSKIENNKKNCGITAASRRRVRRPNIRARWRGRGREWPRLIAYHWALPSRMEAGRLFLFSCTTLCDLPMDVAPFVGASGAMRRNGTRCGKSAAERRTLHGGGGRRPT
ncbi:putative inactive receptor kinase-like [Dorcoceras hygrometricum]|uniref:Putative inactive receptor kinase-like n=1 Tax=Dorcoceras hygrometricum TaxID=472368 RepID=A0A2Z6ZV27_9LAMI|nr:putative inactive receptor kinase-like [Dorcoceras hygrometricum]